MPPKTTTPGGPGRGLGTGGGRGRAPLGDRPMTAAERMRKTVATRKAAGLARKTVVTWEKSTDDLK